MLPTMLPVYRNIRLCVEGCDSCDQKLSTCCRGAECNYCRQESTYAVRMGICVTSVLCVHICVEKLTFISVCFVCSTDCGSCFQHVITEWKFPPGIIKHIWFLETWPRALGGHKKYMVHVWVATSICREEYTAQQGVSWLTNSAYDKERTATTVQLILASDRSQQM